MKRFVTEVLTMHQDYLWFLATLALLGALVAALRPVPGRGRQSWVAWTLGGNLLMALAELVRMAQAVRPPEMGPPNLVIDLFHGTVLALQVAVLCWPAGVSVRGIAQLAVLLGLAALRLPHPWPVTLGLCAAATAGVLWRVRREPGLPDQRLAWALIPTFWLSPIGPATGMLNAWIVSVWSRILVVGAPREEDLTFLTMGLRRWSTTGAWGVWASLGLLAAGLYGLRELTRRWPEGERQELRRLIPLTCLWLGAGMALAAGLGWRAKHDFEAAQKMRANLAAKLLDPAELAEAFGPKFDPQLIETGPARHLMATLGPEFKKAVLPVRRRLSLIQEELPADSFAFVMIQRNGLRLAGAVAASFSTRSDRNIVLSPEPDFAEDHQTHFLPPFQEVYGLVTQARAPLFFPDGKFLGWMVLEFGPGEWVSGQTQARLQALIIVGLGFGLAIVGLRQRLRNLVRDEAVRSAEVARQANHAKSQFLARVSHELRTPIQSVLGNCDLLEPALREEPARTRLAALRQHGQLMARLVEDLLDLGALQTGRFHLVPQPSQLGELVRQTTESLRARAEARGLELRVSIGEPPHAWRLADGERVGQVVLNLVSNAIKFTDHGTVEVDFSPTPDGGLRLTVSDTGPGIAPGEEAKLFQPFARLQPTAAKEGRGLGLALARGLCEDMQGGLALVRGSPGACFVARFLLPPCSPPAPQFTALQMASLHGRTILVVDDNTLIRELFHTCFIELGASCTVAADGPAALQLATRIAYDTIVLDLAMPGMNGADVARTIRQSGRFRPQIIGVSAHAAAADRAQALAAGMDAFLTKPVDLRRLVQEIAAASPGREVAPRLPGLIERLRGQFRTEAPGLAAALAAAVATGDFAAVAAHPVSL